MKKLVLLAALVAGSAAFADGVQPPIRVFDLPAIERLGQAMYDQDQEAWKATDAVMAQHSQSELQAGHALGWVVETFPDHDLVRFIHQGAGGPEASYDVTVSRDGKFALSEPQDRKLSDAEMAQHLARRTAIGAADRHCARTYNTVALKDPQGGGWLVWVMAATTDPNLIVIGGHTRFTISADGRTIQTTDVLSKSCQQFPRTAGPDGKPGALIFTHVIEQTPIETDVFASLSYKMPFRIGTLDGKAWKVDGAAITNIDMDMPDIDGFAARTLAGYDEKCFVIAKDTDGKYRNIPASSVMQATEHDPAFTPPVLDSGLTPASMVCGRNDLVPAPNDYKVLNAGLTLFIHDIGAGHPARTGVLEIVGGRIQFRMIAGKMDEPELQKRLQARLDTLQNAVQKKP